MIYYLLPFLTSFIIQFGAVTFPIDIVSQNAVHEVFAQTVVSNFNSTYNKSIDYSRVIIVRRNNNTYPYYLWIPIELYDPNVTSSITINSRTDTYCSITNSGWIRYQVMSNGTVPTSTSPNTSSSIGNLYYSDSQVNNGLIYNGYYTLPINQVDTFIVSADEDLLPVFNDLGSFSLGGHSSSTSPESAISGSSWSNLSGSFALTGHSVGVSKNQSTPDFTNPTQNLLGQIIDNTNNIIQNIKGLGDVVLGIGTNIREGFSSIFNALSVFNNNCLSFFNYLVEPLDHELILDHIEDMSFYTLSSTISSAGSHISSSINSVSDNQSLIFPIDLRDTIFSNAGIMYLDLTFLDDTKSTWQPLLIAFLYFTLGFNILMSLPSIIQGQSREGGKSD